MSTDVVDLGFRVDTTDIDQAVRKLGLLDREFGKVERSGGLVARSFASVGEAGQKSGGLVSRAFREASQEIDRAMRSAVGLAASLMNLRRNLTDTDMRIRVSLDNAQAIADLAALRNTPDVSVRINVSANVSGAVAALQAVNALARDRDVTIRVNAVGSAGAAASINTLQRAIAELNASLLVGIQLLNDYSDSLDRVRRSANDAADAIRRAADEQERLRRAGGGLGGGNSETGWRRHARSVLDTANAYSGLAVRLLAAKSAIAVLTAAAAGAIPVLGQMAAAAGAVFGTALATANVAAMSKELSKLTETTGASADGLQKWRLAARFEGVDAALNEFGDMAGVFTDLSSQMDKLGTESGKDFAEGLKLIGLSAKQIKDMKPEEALLAIGDAIAKSKMSTRDKTAFLGAISDDAAKLLPLLEKTGQKFNEIADYASKVGAIQSDAQLAAMKQTNTELSYFKVGLEGVQTQLAAVGSNVINTLGPNIKKLFVDAKTPLDEWALSVDIVLTKFKHDLDSTGSWGTAFARMFEGMYPTLYQFIGSAGKFGKGYGEAFIAPMLDALKRGYAGISESLGNAGGAESLGKGLGEAMLPVITIVDTIVASIKLLINNWDALKAVAAVTPVGFLAANWDPIVAVFESVGNGIRRIGEAFGLLNPATTANATGVQVFVAALGALLVSGAASRLVLGAIGATFNTLSFALAPLGAVLGIVATGLKAVALAAMANPIGALITVIAMGAALIFTNWSKVGEFFTGLWAGVKNSFSGLIDWWNNTTPKQKVLDIKAATIDVAREKYTQFVSWLDNTTPKQKIIDIATGSVSIAQKAVDLFIARWNESLIRSWALDVKTSALDYAEQKANEFSSWWESWTLKEVVADVTYETLVWAWGKGKEFSAWLNSWVLPSKDVKLDFSIIEIARNAVQRFMDWISTIEFKLPEIKLPNIAQIGANVGAKLRKVGGDIADGLAEGMNRATSHISAAEKVAGAIEPTMRNVVQSRSPSKITEAIGADTAAGLGLGIEKGGKGVKTAAAKTAQAATDAFKSIMEGLNKQLLSFTAGDEVARRYELTQQKIVGTNQDVVIATEAKIKAFEDERKKTEEAKATAESAAKAYADLVSGLKGQIVTLTQGDEAGRRYDLTQQKIAGSSQDVAISLQNQVKLLEAQKTVKEDLARVNAEALSLDAQMTALKSGGVAAMQVEEVRQSALNDLKEKGIGIESSLVQQYLAGKAAVEAKTKALAIEQDIQKGLRDIDWLSKEIEATQKGAAVLADFNVEKAVSNALSEKNLTLESDQGRRVAETTRQLFAKNKQLEIGQSLYQLRTDNEWLRKEIEATTKGEKALKELNIQKALFAELSRLGIKASSEAAIQLEREIRQQFGLRDALEETQKAMGKYSGLGDALAQGMLSGNWKQAGKDILAQLKGTFVDPLKKSLSDAIAQGLAGGANGGFLGSIAKLLNFDGIKGALGGVGNSIGGLFSGIASSAANGFAGIGTAISGGLSGIMGSFGTLVSAIPGWGWALAGVAGLAKLFGGPSAPKINLTQGARDGQGMLTDGQQHYTKTALGTVGATDSSYKIGREKGFVPKLHEWFKWVESFDGMIAKTLPNSIASISEALKGVEMKGANLEGFTRQRLHTIFSALPEALQVAIQGGKNIMAGTTEEIAARFTYMAQVAESGLIPALEQLGLAGTQSKEAMIAFAMSLADAMGGIDAAKAALDNYYQAAYTEAERLALSQSAAKSKLDEYNKSLGLSGAQYIDTIAELRAYIDAQDKNTEAGRKAIAAALGMVDALKTLGGTAEETAQKLKGQWTDFNAAAYTDAQRESIAKNQAQKLVDQFNKTYGTALKDIIDLRQLMRTIDTTTEAGRKMQQAALGLTGSLVTLGGTAEQIKQKIAGLRESIKGLVTNLYSSGSSSLTSTSSSTADSNQAALSAAQASLDSLRSQLNSEQDRISEVNNQAKEAYQNQLDYFRTLKDAAEDLRNVARGFADDARDAADTLKSAQLDYNQTLRAAQGGDVEAAKKLGEMANRLKSAVSISYNGDSRASLAIQQIEAQLRSTAGVLDGLAGAEPNDPGTISSTLIASLQSQISAQESLVSSLQSQISSAGTAANEAKATADRAAMAKELATKIGELGLATDKSAWQILAQNGINIKDLAKDFGINVNQLDVNFAKKVGELSGLLNVNSLQLLSKLGVSVTDLASAYGINTDRLNAGMVTKIGELAGTLNVNSWQLLSKLGLTAQEIAAAYGLNTDKLNQNFLTKLDSLADVLKVSSVELAAKLGINIDKLGDLMANKLAALPNIPADIKAGLAPHLQDIRNAADPATLQRELKELQAYVNTLPPGIRSQLNAQLNGIVGNTGDQLAQTKADALELQVIRNVKDKIWEQTVYLRDGIGGSWLSDLRANLRALNKNAANIGKAAIPSFAVGSDKLPSDMLANVHSGEMIFTAAQSNSMRDLAIYNQSVIPQIASYLSDIAANDAQAPVFIQPLYMPTINHQQRQTDSKKDEDNEALRMEIKELRKAVETMIPYQSAIANNTRKTAATLDKWDTDGQPEERVA